VKQQYKAPARGVVFVARHFPANFGFDAQLFPQLTGESLFWRFSRFHFPARELPLEAVTVVGHPLPDQDASIPVQNSSHNNDRRSCHANNESE
jgi:hypothetical protein